ncbi:MAG: cytochrome ubiquinol oxidase subunit I, partial [Rhodospirillales bacterium]|nr:cytochrome ubiquinol oxidase subunit I [Rhodospirillales bacterium]
MPPGCSRGTRRRRSHFANRFDNRQRPLAGGLGDRLHFLATLTFCIGILVAGVCILARNSWMQTPAGFAIIDGEIRLVDWVSAILSPSFPYRFVHMFGAALLSTAMFILGISAWYLLRGRHRSFARYSL